MSAELSRHVDRLLSRFAAEYGEVDLVGRRVDCEPDDYDALKETFETFGVVGGASVRIRDDGRLLLVRYDGADGWVDPGDGRRPGESYRECARRGVRDTVGLDVRIDDLAQVHLLYMDDWTDRVPLPNPFVSFDGRPLAGDATPREGVVEARWFDAPPEELLYEELAEASQSR